MSKKNRKKFAAKPARSTQTHPPDDSISPDSVLQAIEAGNVKAAVLLAKQYHQIQRNDASEQLLVRAYQARVKSLIDKNMTTEARELAAIIKQRYPRYAAEMDTLHEQAALRSGRLDGYLVFLTDPAISREKRREIEDLIRRNLMDPAVLANAKTLPATHPLREAARAVREALAAVVARPASDDEIELAHISRRSPLAPWKMLVRAIAYFYRGEDDLCRQWLDAMDADSYPARIAPTLKGLMDGTPTEPMAPAQQTLCSLVQLSTQELERQLELFHFFYSSQHARFDKEAKSPTVLKKYCAQLSPPAQQEMIKRLYASYLVIGAPEDILVELMQFRPVMDAVFWKNLALQAEHYGAPMSITLSAWRYFGICAVDEGLFGAKDHIAAGLLRHMATLAAEAFLDGDDSFEDGPDGIKAPTLNVNFERQPQHLRRLLRTPPQDTPFCDARFNPDHLFQRLCEFRGAAEDFRLWLEFAEDAPDLADADRVIEHWLARDAKAVEPLLKQVESSHRRKAYTKALKYLTLAEERDPLNPETRRKRLNLTTAIAARHLRQGKINLLEKDIQKLQELPVANENVGAIVTLSIEWVLAALANDNALAKTRYDNLIAACGGEAGAYIAAGAVCVLGKLPAKKWQPKRPQLPKRNGSAKTPDNTFIPSALKGLEAARLFLEAPGIPTKIEEFLHVRLIDRNLQCDMDSLLALGNTVLRLGSGYLAFAASVAGLRVPASPKPVFLLLRARSFRYGYTLRPILCAIAAWRLAQWQCDNAMAAAAREFMSKQCPHLYSHIIDMINALSRSDIDVIVAAEKKLGKFKDMAIEGFQYEKRLYKCGLKRRSGLENLLRFPLFRMAISFFSAPTNAFEDFADDEDASFCYEEDEDDFADFHAFQAMPLPHEQDAYQKRRQPQPKKRKTFFSDNQDDLFPDEKATDGPE